MFAAQRRRLILEQLQARGTVSLQDLVGAVGASPVTIRRDLAALQADGLLVRRRGGAALPEGPGTPGDRTGGAEAGRRDGAGPGQGDGPAGAAKLAVAELAATLVEDGDALLLGGGTTVSLLARALIGVRRLTVVTNSLLVAEALAAAPGAGVVITGGALHPPTFALVGSAAEQSLSGLRARRAFLSGDGFTAEWGLSTASLAAAGVDRAIAQAAQEIFVLADASKLGRDSLTQSVPADRIDHLVTDDGADPAYLERLTRNGIQVHVAASEPATIDRT